MVASAVALAAMTLGLGHHWLCRLAPVELLVLTPRVTTGVVDAEIASSVLKQVVLTCKYRTSGRPYALSAASLRRGSRQFKPVHRRIDGLDLFFLLRCGDALEPLKQVLSLGTTCLIRSTHPKWWVIRLLGPRQEVIEEVRRHCKQAGYGGGCDQGDERRRRAGALLTKATEEREGDAGTARSEASSRRVAAIPVRARCGQREDHATRRPSCSRRDEVVPQARRRCAMATWGADRGPPEHKGAAFLRGNEARAMAGWSAREQGKRCGVEGRRRGGPRHRAREAQGCCAGDGRGKDWSVFLKVAGVLLILNFIGAMSLQRTFEIGLPFLFIAFYIYEKREEEIDAFCHKILSFASRLKSDATKNVARR
ncbi:hypothetical protein Taro_029135 [Colocasia esculenta]|uniref:Reticulon domain-containing protein n=1 Tax=Colocasia esculenta TaxID=4460 RepID=A0A843VD26_COLES|nr:hypothetical protein [Colocasia esculenta]